MNEDAVLVAEVFDNLSTEVSVPKKGYFTNKEELKLLQINGEDVAKGCIGFCFIFDSLESARAAFPNAPLSFVATKESVVDRIKDLQNSIDASMASGYHGSMS